MSARLTCRRATRSSSIVKTSCCGRWASWWISMSLSRLTSSQAEFVNKLANDPGVLGQLGYVWLDFTGFFDHAGNIALADDEHKGVALFGHRGAGVYEGHYL